MLGRNDGLFGMRGCIYALKGVDDGGEAPERGPPREARRRVPGVVCVWIDRPGQSLAAAYKHPCSTDPYTPTTHSSTVLTRPSYSSGGGPRGARSRWWGVVVAPGRWRTSRPVVPRDGSRQRRRAARAATASTRRAATPSGTWCGAAPAAAAPAGSPAVAPRALALALALARRCWAGSGTWPRSPAPSG